MYLRITGLNKSFGSREVVKDLHLELPQGEILCLLGSSGCGKTTTLKIISGLLQPDGGRIEVDGQDITAWQPENRPVSMVFQSYALFPNMTVLQNVIYGLKLRKVRRKDALKRGMEYLETADLREYANARVYELSGGQQQRVALMRSLILNPKLILLDEPLSNLDMKLREKMRLEIKELQKRFNLTMVFVTHDQQEAMTMASTIAIMNNGKIVQAGSPTELYNNPVNDFVLNFLGETNTLTLPDGLRRQIRPEDITLHADGQIAGIVRRNDYFGFYRKYVVDTEQGPITVLCSKNELHNAGDLVRLSINHSLFSR